MLRCAILVALLLMLAGCEEENAKVSLAVSDEAVTQYAQAARASELATGASKDSLIPAAVEELAVLPIDRKIVYDASISLRVKKLEETTRAIPELAAQFGGYLSEKSVQQSAGAHPGARWVVRVPVERFQPFVEAVSLLGTPVVSSQKSQDVTEEFVDLEARIKSKQQLEARFIKIAEEKTGEIKQLLAVEEELSRVRSEIERMQGRMRFLTDRTSFSTVTIDVREEADYVPPREPTFGNRIASAWSDSTRDLASAFQNLVIGAVRTIAWSPILAVLAGTAWLAIRVARSHRRKPRTSPQSPAPA